MAYPQLGAIRDLRGGVLAAAELPRQKQRAAAVGMWATLALAAASRQPDRAAVALAELAERAWPT